MPVSLAFDDGFEDYIEPEEINSVEIICVRNGSKCSIFVLFMLCPFFLTLNLTLLTKSYNFPGVLAAFFIFL